MADMFPRELLPDEVKSNGERKTFDALRDRLADPWQAYHSVSWVARDHGSGAIDGEIDFVVCHPEQAVVCLEVKGGTVESRGGSWYGVRDGERTRIKDPFTQALDHRYALQRHLEANGVRDAKRWLIGQAIVLPDVTVHQLSLAPDAPRELIIDRADLRDPEAALKRVVAFHRGARDGGQPPGFDGAATLREQLVPSVTLRVPMAEDILEEEEALIHLTAEQALLLARMRRTPRLAVSGCAGSGKTMLAVEHARRLAHAGTKVLFVCFNRGLAEHLRARETRSGVTVQTFHGICNQLARQAKLKLPQYEQGKAPPEYFERDLPDALVDAVAKLGPQFGALVVDEAQDLQDDWYEGLLCVLDDERKANVWLFFDDNQRIYASGFAPPDDFLEFELTVNCRNTQAIHHEVMKLYRGSIVPDVKGPAGRELERHRTVDQAATVADVIERLCDTEEVLPQDVVVLSAHGWENSEVRRSLTGRYTLTQKRGELGRNVYFSSIRAFKGLEAPVVILCELEDLDENTRDQQLYVGISRARNHCVIVAPLATA
jgi:predicted ATPase